MEKLVEISDQLEQALLTSDQQPAEKIIFEALKSESLVKTAGNLISLASGPDVKANGGEMTFDAGITVRCIKDKRIDE